MILYPNCKINFGLRVLRKREDGYHDLETVFLPIYGLHDELEVDVVETTKKNASVKEDETIHFVQEGIVVDCPAEDNLIVKCYRHMAARYPQIGPVSVRFRKNIPFGAGLGGGSSDAAHMAIALNELFGLGLGREQLAQEVRPLGADCPFFVYNTPCYATGIGDELTPIELDMSGLRIIMIKPNEGVSTREAYGGITRHPEAEGQIKSVFSQQNEDLLSIISHSSSAFINDFEASVFPHHPAIEHIKKRLLDADALFASMTGSGSTVYGLFEDDTEGSTNARLRVLEQEFASMILLNDTLAQR